MDQYFDAMQKKRIYYAVLSAIVILAVFLGIKSISALKELSYIGRGTYPSNVISVSGKGEVSAVPDIASLSFSVVEEGKTVREAQDKATAKMNAAIATLKSMGIEDKDIKTQGYNSYPKYDYKVTSTVPCAYNYCPPGKPVITGYEVSQTVQVKIRKTDDAGDVLTKIGSLGVSNISGLEFVIDDMDALKVQARDKAIADAKSKANALSKSLGVKLKKVANFYETGDQPIPMYAGGTMMDLKAVSSEATVAPNLPVGENKVISNIVITYEIN